MLKSTLCPASDGLLTAEMEMEGSESTVIVVDDVAEYPWESVILSEIVYVPEEVGVNVGDDEVEDDKSPNSPVLPEVTVHEYVYGAMPPDIDDVSDADCPTSIVDVDVDTDTVGSGSTVMVPVPDVLTILPS